MPRSSTGDHIPDDLPQTITYNADGSVATASIVSGAKTWVQTYTWTNGSLASVSAWVLQ